MDLLLHPPPLSRLRPGHWVAIDCAVTAVLALTHPAYQQGVPRWVGAALVAVAVLPAAVRRRWPRGVLAVVTVSGAAAAALTTSPAPPLAVASVMYLIPLRFTKRDSAAMLGGALLVTAAGLAAFGLIRHGAYGPGGLAPAAGLLGEGGALITAAWAIGYCVALQRAYAAGEQEQARRRAREQVAQMRRASTEERLQIARELHDVVAHSMSLIAVQAGVANYVIGVHPEEAARALSSIEQTSRGALQEMRALLQVLRAEPDEAGLVEAAPDGAGLDGARPALPADRGLVPTPGLDSLDRLAARTAQAGVRVDLDVRGERPRLSPGMDLAAYRVIQEAVTNVIKHSAADSCQVTVAYQPDLLTLQVTDDGAGPDRRRGGDDGTGAGRCRGRDQAAGHGIAGMRERVGMYGGQFQAGPLPGRGYRVAARFPLDSAPGGTAA